MKRLLPSLILIGALWACGEGDPMARTEDLPAGLRRVAAEATPTAAEIAGACFSYDANACRDDPETRSYCEPMEGDYLVRSPRCVPVAGDRAALDCRFGATVMSWGAPEEAYRRLRPRDFDETAGRFVRVVGRGGRQWVAASYCRRPT